MEGKRGCFSFVIFTAMVIDVSDHRTSGVTGINGNVCRLYLVGLCRYWGLNLHLLVQKPIFQKSIIYQAYQGSFEVDHFLYLSAEDNLEQLFILLFVYFFLN